MTFTMDADPAFHIARHYEAKPRQYARPGDLARALDPTTRTQRRA